MVTFGGAYAVLAYVAQQAVEHYRWLQPGEMLDGLGIAETTPGPLIMVLQFVGFMAAYRDPGALSRFGPTASASTRRCCRASTLGRSPSRLPPGAHVLPMCFPIVISGKQRCRGVGPKSLISLVGVQGFEPWTR
jgi:Chromate transporter